MNERSTSDALDALCAWCGVARHYTDIWGGTREPSLEHRLALLRALGIPVHGPEEAGNALDTLLRERALEILPPVRVVRGRDSASMELALADPAAPLEWCFETEAGERSSGTLDARGLEQLGTEHIGDLRQVRYRWPIPVEAPPGYHWLVLSREGSETARCRVIACPAACYAPPALEQGARLWGPAVQLYALRSARNWGMGDFGDLKTLLDVAAGSAAGFVGLNPLHALDPHRPCEASPYSPSSRHALNVLYLDIEALPDFKECAAARKRLAAPAFRARLDALRAAELVDYSGVARAKLEILPLLHAHFREHHLARNTSRAEDFRTFQAAGGEPLKLHALFDALQERFCAENPGVWGWPAWPGEYHDPRGDAVASFLALHPERVEYFQYLQWQADVQLGEAQRHARALSMPIDFYLDLAVGASPGGAEVWSSPTLYARDASIGAPPDEFNLAGQDWGLAAPAPGSLRSARYQPFIAILQAAMRHAGALRIDHVMGLMRLFWVPRGATPLEGTYVSYPFEDLLGIVALESHRNACLVIGEDLGTVPDAVRQAMASQGILSYRPLYFQRGERGDFLPPEAYPRDALATVSTHDLPTLRGFWRGRDLELRQLLGLFPSDEMRKRMILDRSEDRARLILALEHADLEPSGDTIRASANPDLDQDAVRAVHEYVARTPAKLFAVQLEDVFGQVEQVNMPATWGDAHPNWRRKLGVPLERWRADDRYGAIAALLAEQRGSRTQPLEEEPRSPRRTRIIPGATYRWQFNGEFGFAAATARVPYLAALGITHVYASSYLKARAGSSHGYDIVDHNAFNPEIGSEQEFDSLAEALRVHGMGQMLDLVPNHMGVLESDNAWWLDLLENGPAARHARYFDIDWEPADRSLHGKVLLPVLGEQYGAALEAGLLDLCFDPGCGEFSVHYYAHRFPLDPREYPRILGRGIDRLDGDDAIAFRSLVTAFGHLPARTQIEPDRITERARDKELRKRELVELCARSAPIARFIADKVAAFKGRPGEPASYDELHRLIDAQAFRLAHWRVAADDINYRRFFEINELAALRMESETVFEDTHRLVLRLLAEGKVDALRIDHPDGLRDPKRYLERLQAATARAFSAAGRDSHGRCIYVVVEKILALHEGLPPDWPVDGTTGYRFANVVNGLFVDAAAEPDIDQVYLRFTGERHEWATLVRQSKRLVMWTSLASELNRLTSLLNRIAKSDRHTRDFTFNSLRQALQDLVANLPVYRTYIGPSGAHENDLRHLDWAIAESKKRPFSGDTSVYDFVRDVLGSHSGAAGPLSERQRMCAEFIARFQQFSAPVMAKGSEDRAFYIYNRLVSLNEVGGDPERFGISLEAFHAALEDGAKSWPHTMLATSTHDNKRSEDVRARIDVISETVSSWRRAIGRWARMNAPAKTALSSAASSFEAPSRNDEYLLYQTLLGAWPLAPPDADTLADFRGRIQAYMLKAVREAKVHTSWLNPEPEYERALARFIDAMLGAVEGNAFMADFLRFAEPYFTWGLLNSLAQVAIKFTAPGVPDLYQGNELWDFSLVDPDNRRPVDYARRSALLAELRARMDSGRDIRAEAEALASRLREPQIKLFLTWRLLGLRARLPELFREGDYARIGVRGAKATHVCAFARQHASETVITVVPRLVARLTGEARLPVGDLWGDTRLELPASELRSELTGETFQARPENGVATLRLAEVLSVFPVQVLVAC